jgi:hypothetical protein
MSTSHANMLTCVLRMHTLRCRLVDKTIQQDVMIKSISCKASEQVGFKMLTSRQRTRLSDMLIQN